MCVEVHSPHKTHYYGIHRPRSIGGHNHPPALGRRRAGRQLGPPRPAAGRRANGLRAVVAPSPLQPGRSALAQPRPLCAFGRPRLDAAVQPAAPVWLRPPARRIEVFPPVGIENPRPPRVWADARRGSQHWPARPGLREWRGHGDRRGIPVGIVPPGRLLADRSLHLRDRFRR